MTITLREITEDNAEAVLAVQLAPGQERFVTSVADSLSEADGCPQGNPWFRAVYADGRPVGFVMLSWNVDPQPPEINGPWFLWELLIDHWEQDHLARRVLSARWRTPTVQSADTAVAAGATGPALRAFDDVLADPSRHLG